MESRLENLIKQREKDSDRCFMDFLKKVQKLQIKYYKRVSEFWVQLSSPDAIEVTIFDLKGNQKHFASIVFGIQSKTSKVLRIWKNVSS